MRTVPTLAVGHAFVLERRDGAAFDPLEPGQQPAVYGGTRRRFPPRCRDPVHRRKHRDGTMPTMRQRA